MAMLSKKSPRPPSRRSSPYFEDLEPRILFSAEAASALAWLDQPSVTPNNPLLDTSWSSMVRTQSSTGSVTGAATPAAIELVFIDAKVSDRQLLTELIQRQTSAGRVLEIHQIQGDASGIEQITRVLQEKQGVSAIHILSHGSDGQVLLGNSSVDKASLPSFAGALSQWSGALAADADLLFYGCDVASTEVGQAFLADIACLTGADVAASSGITGHAAQQGDWELEQQLGQITTSSVLTAAQADAWQHVLPTLTLRDGTNGYTGTTDTYLELLDPGANNSASATLLTGRSTFQDPDQALIKFENIVGISANQIPTGSVVTSVSLTVYISTPSTFTNPTYGAFKMLTSWSDTSTYTSMGDGVDGLEANFVADQNISENGAGSYTFNSNAALINTVQGWINNPSSNQGWMIYNDDNTSRMTMTSSEGATVGNRPTLTITYTAPTPPSMDLDANNSSTASGNDYIGTFIENNSPVNVADPADANISAGSSSTLTSMSVTISNLLNGTAESLSASTGGTSITADYDELTGVLSLTGNDTAAHYQQVLRSITYSNASDTPNTTVRTLNIVLTDSNGQTASATSTINVNSTNDSPVISSNGGGSSASVNVSETLTAVATVVASDPESTAITYSIVAGGDGGFFSIGSGTGVLTFSSAPDFETPLDANGDNTYVVTVRASDGSLFDTQVISVTVDNVVSTLTVNTTTDNNDTGLGSSFTSEQLNASKGTDGKVSLQEAIIAANTTAGTDTIAFGLSSGAGVYGEYTITVGTGLPNLTGTVVIDGTTQSGYSTLPLIVLDGNGGSGDGLYLSNTADGSTIKGLLIRDFSANGIYVQSDSDNNTITGNLIGSFNADGSNAGAGESNLSEGIESYGANLTVGGSNSADRNVISGNGSAYNVYLGNGSSGSTVKGNYLGTNAAGTSVFSTTNSAYGVMIESASTNVTIGGVAQGEGNVISGFTTHGIWVTTSGNTTIQGNHIGTDHTGNVDLGNSQYGIYVDDTGDVVIGGTSTYAGNLISGNNAGGIRALNSGSVTVLGNIIGLDIDGTTALANSGPGIYLSTGAASTIGGNGATSRNTISGNTGHGIEVHSNDHVIKGNYVGVGINGSTLIGNGQAGIYIVASDVTVGGKTTGDGNVIAGNGAGGVVVASGTGNLFYQNSIHSNTGLGIDLGNDGLTNNDNNDGDGGANWQNNFPVITSVVTNGSSTTITGSIDWYPQSQPIYIEFFSDTAADASGHGEGRTYLGYVQVTTEATTGDASFSATLTGVSVGEWITAVANIEAGPTGASEFALSVQAVATANAPRGRVIWNVNDRFNPYYANWSSSGFSGTGTTGINFTDDMSMILAAESPTRDEIIFVGAADVSGKILAGIWNGSTWASTLALPVADPGTTAADYNSFAVAYDAATGDAMLVWDNGTTGSNGLSYAVWDGSSWSAIQTIAAPVSGNVTHVRMAASQVDSEMTLVAHTDQATNNQFAMVWNGSSWGNGQLLGTNDNEQYYEINVAYEQLSGRSLVFYEGSDTDSPDVYYRIWNGSIWSGESIITAPAGIGSSSDLYSTAVASDPNSNRIAVAAKNATEEVWLAVWSGSSWGDKQVATTSGNELVHDHPTMSLAFEGQSGDLIAAYGKASGPAVYFRTWTAGVGWSGEQTGPSVGGTDIPYIVKLYADPYSDTVMLGMQDNASDIHFTAWDGSAWGSVTQLEADSGFTYRENFVYVWNITAPMINDLGGDTLAYTEDQSATVIDQGGNASVQVNGSHLGSGNLTVAFANGSTSAEDALGIRNQGNGAGQIGLSGSNVNYEGTLIGTYTGGTLGAALVISLNSNATATAVSALVRNITYENINQSNPSTTSRTVRFSVTDSYGTTSANIDTTVTVASANDAPIITSNGGGATGTTSINENTTTVSTVTYTDPDGTTDLAFSIVGGADSALFSINASGVLSFVSAPNAEAPLSSNGNNQYVVSVRVSDGSANDTQTLTVTVSDVDEFNVGAVTDANASSNAVVENASNGALVGITASATDADISNNTISYTLSDDAGGRFTINASTGVVTVANGSLLNYEAATSHNITVVATSSDGSTSNQTFTIALTDVNEAPVGAVSDINATGNAVAENASNGTTVSITASATDPDGSATVSYSLSDDAGGRFTINASTGVVTVANGSLLNYEAANSHNITVVATSSDGSTSNQTFNISLTDVNEAPVGAVSDVNASGNAVAENASNGATIGITASATDPDGSATVSYSLSDDAGGRFTINASTGVVTVANGSLLNYEAATSHDITVVATSSDGSTSNQTFSISLTDANEAPVGAVSDVNASGNSVAENASNGTTVGITASATDPDGSATVSYSLSDDAGGRFTINSSTGVVTVANGSLLNYEAASSHGITVVATSSDGSTSNQTFTISLTDANEAPVGAVTDVNASSNAVAENATNGASVGITASATDPDGSATVSYSLSDDAGGRFTINTSTGVVTVANGSLLNYEAATSHGITVVATSTDGSTSNQTFNISLTDVNEAPVGAVSDVNASGNSVAENASNGTTVGITASATDPDGSATVSYSLSDDAGGRFTINASTGVVTVANGSLLNYEAATSHDITVVATSSDGSTSNQSFTISILDVSDTAIGSITDINAVINTAVENASNGVFVGITASAIDPDGSDTVSYSLSDDAGGRFTINASTGVVTVANGSLLNYEAATSHDITVVATSSDGSTSNQSFTISLTDANEAPVGAVSDANASGNSVAENASNGATVGITASATDPDGSATVSYALSDDAGGRFTINASTGVVTVANGSLLNYEAATSHNITVVATSSDGSTSNQTFTISLTDANEAPVGAVSDVNASGNSVAENASNGTLVGITAAATDPDGSATVSYSLSDDAGGRFTINASTGVVTVANGSLLNYEAATSHNITVVATSSDGSTSNQAFTISLTDVNEALIGAVSDVNASGNAVAENATNGASVGITASATDPDGSATVSYSLSDDAGGRFTINTSTGVVTVANGSLLNYEAATSHGITVMATSTDGSTSNQTFTISLTDANEAPVGAVSDVNASGNAVAENASNGTTVGITASATDPDGSATVSYSLSDDAGGRFTINTSTGVVTVANGSLLNYEAATSHDITIMATSSDGSTSNQSFTVSLTDANEAPVGAVSDVNASGNAVAENASNGALVGITAAATDPDGSATVSYSLSDDAGGRFTINASTGVVTVANGSLLNYEAATSHNITVVATSSDGSTSNQAFTISLTDVNEALIGAVSDVNASGNTLAENASNGALVGITAAATDPDGSATVSYSLSDDAGGRFTINSSTGVVTVANGSLLNYEAATSNNITVVATSTDGSTSNRGFTIALTNVNDNSPIITIGDGQSASMPTPENRQAVGNITVQDPDGVDSINYLVVGGDDAQWFVINPSTGDLSFVAPPDYENPFEQSGDNRYEVIVQVSDGSFSQSILLEVTVQDQADSMISVPDFPPDDRASEASPQNDAQDTGTAVELPATDTSDSTDKVVAPTTDEPSVAPVDAIANMDESLQVSGSTANPASWFVRTTAQWSTMDTGRSTFSFENMTLSLAQTLQTPPPGPMESQSSFTYGFERMRLPDRVYFDNAPEGDEFTFNETSVRALKGSGIALTVGAVWWAARAGGLIASMVATTPAWRTIDPLPVLFSRDDPEGDEPIDEEADSQTEQMFDVPRTHVFDPRSIT